MKKSWPVLGLSLFVGLVFLPVAIGRAAQEDYRIGADDATEMAQDGSKR